MWLFHEHPNEPRPIDFKLATLCHHFGVPFHAASAHDALGDVTVTVALYRAMANKHDQTGLQNRYPALVRNPGQLDTSAGANSGHRPPLSIAGSNGR
jgi:DNA polymerase III epsilon subunit-like protein